MDMQTPNLGLPFLASGQSQKHVTVNESLGYLDAVVQAAVKSRTLTAPPGSPDEGDRYIVAPSAAETWTGQDGALAAFQDGAWMFYPPAPGWQVWDAETQETVIYDGTAWNSGGKVDQVEQWGIGAPPDASNKLLVQSNSALFTAANAADGGTGDMRAVINKEASGDVGSVLFQSGFTTYAECGLMGDQNFRIKVSGDGVSFTDAIEMTGASGHVGIGGAPSASYKLSLRDDKAGTSGFVITNASADSAASAAFRLDAAAGHYFNFQLYGTGVMYAYSNAAIVLGTYAAKTMRLRTDSTDRMTLHADGRISVGTGTASADFSVDGTLRCGSTLAASLPSASTAGAGAMIYVSDEGSHGEMAFSDGTDWRAIRTGALIS